jgi:hypothetical protein
MISISGCVTEIIVDDAGMTFRLMRVRHGSVVVEAEVPPFLYTPGNSVNFFFKDCWKNLMRNPLFSLWREQVRKTIDMARRVMPWVYTVFRRERQWFAWEIC